MPSIAARKKILAGDSSVVSYSNGRHDDSNRALPRLSGGNDGSNDTLMVPMAA